MKRIGIIFGAILCANVAHAQTETITWDVDGVTTTTTCESGGNITLPTAPTKPGYMFVGWSDFTPIEYIESTGTQLIDTGFKPNQNTRVVMEYMVPTCNTGGGVAISGARTTGSSNDAFMLIYAGNGVIRFDHGVGSIECTPITSAFYNNKLNLNMVTPNNFTITNVATGTQLSNCTNNSNNSQSNYSLALFGINNAGNITVSPCPFKVYSFQIYDNNTLVRDMIPVLDPDDVPCMYDKVSEEFYYNAGTGTFGAGNPI